MERLLGPPRQAMALSSTLPRRPERYSRGGSVFSELPVVPADRICVQDASTQGMFVGKVDKNRRKCNGALPYNFSNQHSAIAMRNTCTEPVGIEKRERERRKDSSDSAFILDLEIWW